MELFLFSYCVPNIEEGAFSCYRAGKLQELVVDAVQKFRFEKPVMFEIYDMFPIARTGIYKYVGHGQIARITP